jgi:hypothetical protein
MRTRNYCRTLLSFVAHIQLLSEEKNKVGCFLHRPRMPSVYDKYHQWEIIIEKLAVKMMDGATGQRNGNHLHTGLCTIKITPESARVQ